MVAVRIRFALVVAAVLVLTSCATPGSYQTSTTNGHEKVYKYDETGTKNLVYEVEKDGTLIVHDETDSRAQQMLNAQAKMEQAEQADAERLEVIRAAPKRQPGDAIFVILHDMVLSPDMAKAEHTEGAAMQQFREHFEKDGVIQLVGASATRGKDLTQALRMLSGESPSQAPAADIEVVSGAKLEKKAGINRQTGQIGEYAALVMTATITCNYLPAQYTVSEEGNIFRNAEVSKKFADQIKAVIKDKIGPTIPADRSL